MRACKFYLGEDVLAGKPIYTFIFINIHVYKNILKALYMLIMLEAIAHIYKIAVMPQK